MSAVSRSPDSGAQSRALWLSTLAFTVCFAAWTIFSILGVQIKRDLGLTEFEFGLLDGRTLAVHCVHVDEAVHMVKKSS